MSAHETLTQSVASLPGVGARTVSQMEKLGIKTLQDLVFHLPHRYQDRTKIYPINSLVAGMTVLVSGTVNFTTLQGRRSLVCVINDPTGNLTLRFFHFNARQQSSLSQGTLISCFGEVRNGYQGLEMVHPEYKIIRSTNKLTEDCLRPIYPLTEGLRQTSLRKAIAHVLALCLEQQLFPDYLPTSILADYHYPPLSEALQTLHSPNQQITAEQLQQGNLPALKRLAFEELLAHHLMAVNNKISYQQWQAPIFKANETQQQAFIASLPFQLTRAQLAVIAEINADCSNHHPMLRLIQGDVGSGKTVVAAVAALLAINAGFQVAIMAPTELLAEQHHHSFKQWFAKQQAGIVCLTGQRKGKTRQKTLQAIIDGAAILIIGTHALFQNDVRFNNLGLIIIDEQHRFGVHQRLALREKGQTGKQRPHQLIMTATPIPRTLAMLNYSDLDISTINELPPGRKPVTTSVIPSQRRAQIIAKINQWTANKHQTYWVCTLIEESDILQYEAAEKTTQYLQDSLPNVRIGLIHGRMKVAEKEAIMQRFKDHELDLLVATTVIEVGVDVPNASLMIIENAERLGLSQLHQLRGRVGRGAQQSYCLLVYQTPLSDTSRQRLGILRQSNDGFVIAEKDLQLRGPGDVMGIRQAGQVQFKVANLNRDADLLQQVQKVAPLMLARHTDAISPLIERWLGHNSQYSKV